MFRGGWFFSVFARRLLCERTSARIAATSVECAATCRILVCTVMCYQIKLGFCLVLPDDLLMLLITKPVWRCSDSRAGSCRVCCTKSLVKLQVMGICSLAALLSPEYTFALKAFTRHPSDATWLLAKHRISGIFIAGSAVCLPSPKRRW